MGNYLFFFLFLIAAMDLFGHSNEESINLSLRSLGVEEPLNTIPKLNDILDKYGDIGSLYNRYQETTEALLPIEEKFIEAGIPLFFTMIPYTESKFNPSARGYGTAGLWQFGKQSAKNFGLSVQKGNDGRLDIRRSSDAAIRYLLYLKKEFGSWYLADLAYAMGEGTLSRIIQKNGSKKLSLILKDPHFPSGAKAHFAKTLLLDAKVHYPRKQESKE